MQGGLKLGKHHFDRVKVWRVGRQIQPLCAGGIEAISHAGDLVSGEDVHDDDISETERSDQPLIDISAQAIAIDGAINDPWSDDGTLVWGRYERGGFPVAVGNDVAYESLASWATSIEPSHAGGSSCLVNENQPLGFKAALGLLPTGSCLDYISSLLFSGTKCFFKGDAVTSKESPDRT